MLLCNISNVNVKFVKFLCYLILILLNLASNIDNKARSTLSWLGKENLSCTYITSSPVSIRIEWMWNHELETKKNYEFDIKHKELCTRTNLSRWQPQISFSSWKSLTSGGHKFGCFTNFVIHLVKTLLASSIGCPYSLTWTTTFSPSCNL